MSKPYSKPSFIDEAFREWYLPSAEQCIGYVPFSVAAFLKRKGLLVENGLRLELTGACDSDNNLNTRLEDVREALCAEGLIVAHRDEVMDVTYHCNAEPIATIDRSALRILGLWATKIHVNGIVQVSDDETHLWLSQRSDAANAAPGHWDTLVAGGKASGVSMLETAMKEGWEEAGITCLLMEGLFPRAHIPCIYFSPQGMHRELLVSYDLFLPDTFEPKCNDGEVQDFKRVDAQKLKTASGEALPMKFSSNLVLTATKES